MNTSVPAFPDFRDNTAQPSSTEQVVATRTTAQPTLAMWNDLAAALPADTAWLAAMWQSGIEDCIIAQPGWSGPYEYVTVRDRSERVLGILPFARQRRCGINFLSLAGLYEPHRGLPMADNADTAAMAAVADALHSGGSRTCLRFGPIPETDVAMGQLASELEQRGWRRISTTSQRAIIDLPDSLQEYASGICKRRRKALRRYERKLFREQKDVQIHRFSRENCADWGAVMAELAAVERASWLESANGNLRFAPAHLAELWERLFSLTTPQIEPYAWVIYAGNRPVAFNVGFDAGSVRHEIAGHHDQRFRPYAPGFLLDWYQLQDAFERGIRTVDMGQGDGGYKSVWQARLQTKQSDYVFFPPGVVGTVLHTLVRAAKSKCQ